MPEPMWRRRFAAYVSKFEDLGQALPPSVDNRIEAFCAADQERALSILLGSCGQAIAQPVGNVSEDVAAIFLRTQKHLIALQPIHIKENEVRNSEAGMDHHEDE